MTSHVIMTSVRFPSTLAGETMMAWIVAMSTVMSSASGSRSSLVGQSAIKEYCQFQSFVGACANDEIVMITSGQYGRMRSGMCIAGEGYVGCSSDVTGHLESLCTGRKRCEVSVSSLAKVIQPCKRDFTSYLEAGYLCVKVATDNHGACQSTKHLPLDTERGLLASSTLTDENKVGSSSCPWRLNYKSGQQIRLVLVIYKPGHDEQTSSMIVGSPCPWLLVFEVSRDRVSSSSSKRSETDSLCGRTRMNKLVGDGRSSAEETPKGSGDIHLDIYLKWQGKLANVPVFTVEFEVIGCPDEPSWTQWRRDEVTYKRNGEELVVKCRTSKEIFYLTCSGSRWLGEQSNCSTTKTIMIPQKYGSTLGIPFPQGVIVAVALGLILGLIIGSASLAILFMLRRRKRRSRGDVVDAGDASVYRGGSSASSALHAHSSFDNLDYPTPPGRLHQNFLLPPPPPSSSSSSAFESTDKQLRSNYFTTAQGVCCNIAGAAKNRELAPHADWGLCPDAVCAKHIDSVYRSVQVCANNAKPESGHQRQFYCSSHRDKTELSLLLMQEPSPADVIVLECLSKDKMETSSGSTERLLELENSEAVVANKLSANLPDCAVVAHNKTNSKISSALHGNLTDLTSQQTTTNYDKDALIINNYKAGYKASDIAGFSLVSG